MNRVGSVPGCEPFFSPSSTPPWNSHCNAALYRVPKIDTLLPVCRKCSKSTCRKTLRSSCTGRSWRCLWKCKAWRRNRRECEAVDRRAWSRRLRVRRQKARLFRLSLFSLQLSLQLLLRRVVFGRLGQLRLKAQQPARIILSETVVLQNRQTFFGALDSRFISAFATSTTTDLSTSDCFGVNCWSFLYSDLYLSRTIRCVRLESGIVWIKIVKTFREKLKLIESSKFAQNQDKIPGKFERNN